MNKLDEYDETVLWSENLIIVKGQLLTFVIDKNNNTDVFTDVQSCCIMSNGAFYINSRLYHKLHGNFTKAEAVEKIVVINGDRWYYGNEKWICPTAKQAVLTRDEGLPAIYKGECSFWYVRNGILYKGNKQIAYTKDELMTIIDDVAVFHNKKYLVFVKSNGTQYISYGEYYKFYGHNYAVSKKTKTVYNIKTISPYVF